MVGTHCRADQGQMLGKDAAIIKAYQAVFAGAAAEIGIDHHSIPQGPVIDCTAQSGYFSGAIRPWDVWVFMIQPGPAFSHP